MPTLEIPTSHPPTPASVYPPTLPPNFNFPTSAPSMASAAATSQSSSSSQVSVTIGCVLGVFTCALVCICIYFAFRSSNSHRAVGVEMSPRNRVIINSVKVVWLNEFNWLSEFDEFQLLTTCSLNFWFVAKTSATSATFKYSSTKLRSPKSNQFSRARLRFSTSATSSTCATCKYSKLWSSGTFPGCPISISGCWWAPALRYFGSDEQRACRKCPALTSSGFKAGTFDERSPSGGIASLRRINYLAPQDKLTQSLFYHQ